MSTNSIYIAISQASILIPFITGLRYYKLLDKPFQLLVFFFGFSVIIEAILASVNDNNLPLLHGFTIVECLMFLHLYFMYFKNRIRFISQITVSIFILFIASTIIDFYWLNDIYSFNTLSRTIESVILVGFSLAYYYLFFKDVSEQALWSQPMYWVSTSVLIYFSMNIFLFMLSNYLLKNNEYVVDKGYDIHALFNIIANVIFAQSFRCFQKPQIAAK